MESEQRIGWTGLLLACLLGVGSCDTGSPFVGPGGGGGDPTNPNDPAAPTAESIVMLADPPVLLSDAIDDENGVTLTVIARDADNLVVPGVEIGFSADSGALNVIENVTNENGRVTAILTSGGDPRNRTITVEASAGETQSSITVDVTGTQLQVTGPSSIESGQVEEYSIQLVDAGGNGLRDVTVNVTSENGNAINPQSAVTDVNGLTTVAVTGNAGGQDTLTFTGLGISVTQTVLVSSFGISFLQPDAGIEVPLGQPVTIEIELSQDGTPSGGDQVLFSATRGTLSSITQTTAADGTASVTMNSSGTNGAGPVVVTAQGPENVTRKHAFEFVATTPATISAQVEPATVAPGEEVSVTAVVRDADSNPVKNQVVRFSLNDVSGGELTSSTDITDVQGLARTTYRASSATSAQDGVIITAETGDPVIATDDTTATVAAPSLFIVLGTDNRVVKNDSNATYEKTFNAVITDSAGNPAPPDTVFRLSLRSLEYQKGGFVLPEEGPWVQVLAVPDTDAFYGTPNPNPPPTLGPYFGQGPFGCRSEDPQGTGNINLADDYNNNGQIDPANVAIVPSTAEIDENGVAAFTLRWPQNYAAWILARLTATATVAGTESIRRLDFVLPMAASDVQRSETPPNLVSPFGIEADCTDPT